MVLEVITSVTPEATSRVPVERSTLTIWIRLVRSAQSHALLNRHIIGNRLSVQIDFHRALTIPSVFVFVL
jgi:hypothetical protein